MLGMGWFGLVLPVKNPIGFSAGDMAEMALVAALLLLTIVWGPELQSLARRLAERPVWCMLALAALPVALRLCLLPHHPVPVPDVYDEFGHLLVADTVRHFRLANPAHAMPQFFETFFVLQQPSYSSIYPLGQGLALALGWAIFGLPWAGVVLSVAAFCALCYWMLRGWTDPAWALLGGALAVMQFGPLSLWMNSYWGGALAAAAGCLVFGALPRLRDRWRPRDAALLGTGLAIHLLTRPFESLFLVSAVILFFLPAVRRADGRRKCARAAAIATLALTPAILLTLAQNRQVTGSWTTLPYQLSQYQYGVPASLTFQSTPVPHRELTPQQALDYKMQSSFRGSAPETIGKFLQRLEYRVRYYRFFFLAPLYLAGFWFLVSARSFGDWWVILTLLLFALGTNFFPAFQVHYIAGVTCLFVLLSVLGLQRLSQLRIRGLATGREAAAVLVFLCFAHFAVWYASHVWEGAVFSTALQPFETWDALNYANAEPRRRINRELASAAGPQLVLVRYAPQHIFQDEWVYNEADIDAARVVWARDLGDEDQKLLAFYPRRAVWLLEADAQPAPLLRPYKKEATPEPQVPKSPFEEVR